MGGHPINDSAEVQRAPSRCSCSARSPPLSPPIW
jgi:hypothetical protein